MKCTYIWSLILLVLVSLVSGYYYNVPGISRIIKSAKNLVLEDLPRKTFTYEKKGKLEQFEVPSFDALNEKVRKYSKKFKYADFVLHVGNILVDDQEAFESLPDIVHTLKVDSLSREFSFYKTIDDISDYLEIEEIETVPKTRFPANRTFAKFDVIREEIMTFVSRRCCSLTTDNSCDAKASKFIDHVVTGVQELLSPTTKGGVPPDTPSHLMKLGYERSFTGRRATGTLDILFMHGHEHVVVTVLEAKDMGTNVFDSAVCQLGSQLKAIFEHTLRRYCRQFEHLNESFIEAQMAKYPSFGVVSTADKWAFVKYSKANSHWTLEVSDMLLLTLPLGKYPDQDQLRSQVGNIVEQFAGVLVAGVEDANALKIILAEADSTAAAAVAATHKDSPFARTSQPSV